MPTVYTAPIYYAENMTASDFIFQCSKEFDPAMYGKPLDAETPDEIQPSSYYLHQLEQLRNELDEVRKMTIEQAQQKALEEYNRRINEYKRKIQEAKELKQRYERILEGVQRWEPPTEKHIKLKEFCLNQLNISIKDDCDNIIRYYENLIQDTKLKSGEEWLHKELEELLRTIDRYEQRHEKEVKRVSERNLWIKQLKESLVNL
jgi:lysyl-tRNA synthetase class I